MKLWERAAQGYQVHDYRVAFGDTLEDRPKVVAAARRYSRDPHVPKRKQDHVARVWLSPEVSDEPAVLFPVDGGVA